MKRSAVVAGLCCALLACASAGSNVTPPAIEFVQLAGPADQNYPQGAIEVQYGLRITNAATVPITLRTIQLQSMGLGGGYRLRPETYYFRREIQPQQTSDVTFWAKAVATGDAASADAGAPITLRVTANFDSPSGAFRRVFSKMLAQR